MTTYRSVDSKLELQESVHLHSNRKLKFFFLIILQIQTTKAPGIYYLPTYTLTIDVCTKRYIGTKGKQHIQVINDHIYE